MWKGCFFPIILRVVWPHSDLFSCIKPQLPAAWLHDVVSFRERWLPLFLKKLNHLESCNDLAALLTGWKRHLCTTTPWTGSKTEIHRYHSNNWYIFLRLELQYYILVQISTTYNQFTIKVTIYCHYSLDQFLNVFQHAVGFQQTFAGNWKEVKKTSKKSFLLQCKESSFYTKCWALQRFKSFRCF